MRQLKLTTKLFVRNCVVFVICILVYKPAFGQTQHDRIKSRGASTFDQYSNTATVVITGATPSVAGGNVFKTNNGGAVTVTNFVGGVDSQQIVVLCGDGNTTIQNNANIVVTGGTDFSCTPNVGLIFIFDASQGKWIEGGGTGTGGGGGGGSPAAPEGALQRKTGSNFGASNVTESGTTLNVDDDVHEKGPNPSFDVTRYGVRSFSNPPQTTTATTTASSTAVTLASAIDFINGDGIVIGQAGPSTSLATPAAPSTVAQRAIVNGTTTRCYKVRAEDFANGVTAASASTCTTTAAATLGAVNAATTTGSTASGGIGTWTTAANHNLAPGAQILFGTTGGVYQVISTPTPTTFTTQGFIEFGDVLTSVSSSLVVNTASHIQVYWTAQANVMRWWIYRQDGGAGNFNLIGVSQNSEPYYDDFGYTAPIAPAYVPTTDAAGAINQSIATTIVSGGGTTNIIVANAPATSVSGVTVQHDSTVPLTNAITASQTARGGRISIPKLPAGQYIWINFPWFMPFPGGQSQNIIEMQGAIAAGQPIILNHATYFKGVGDSAGGIPLFSKTYYSQIVGGAYPLVVAAFDDNVLDHMQVYAQAPQQAALIIGSPGWFGVGGPVNESVINSHFRSDGVGGSAVTVTAGGFGMNFDNDVFSVPGVFYGNAALRLLASSDAGHPGIPGIGTVSNSTFNGKGIGIDYGPANGVLQQSGLGSPWSFKNIFTENTCGPTYDFRNAIGNNWSNWEIGGWTLVADWVCGMSYDVDMTGSSTIQGLKISGIGGGTYPARLNVGGAGAGSYIHVEGSNDLQNANTFAATAQTIADYGSGLGSFNRIFVTDSAVKLAGTAPVFATMPPPTNLAGTAVSGGTLTVANHTWTVVAVDWNGGATTRSNTITLAITSPNQTVNLTWTAPTGNPQGYNVYRDNSKLNFSLITTTSVTDTGAGVAGGSPPLHGGGGSSALSSKGIFTPTFILTSTGGFKSTETGTFTANRTWTRPDVTGTAAAINVAQTWSGAQTNMPLTTPAITNGTATGLALTTPTLGGETISASPRGPFNVLFPGALTTTWTGETFTLDKAITVTRVQAQLKTAPSGCGTNAIIRLSDGTTNINLTLTAAANDSGAISQNYAAAAALTASVQTAAATCTVSPGDANVVVQYKTQ